MHVCAVLVSVQRVWVSPEQLATLGMKPTYRVWAVMSWGLRALNCTALHCSSMFRSILRIEGWAQQAKPGVCLG